MGKHKMIAVALGFATIAAPSAGHAQAWIGAVAGNAVAAQQAAAREQACRAGTPAPEPVRARADTQATALMTAYFGLTGTSRERDISKVFARNASTWTDTAGEVAPTALGARLDIATPTLTREAFVVAGDEGTARGVWKAQDADGGVTWYGVDFVGTPGFFSPATWRIKSMTVFPGDRQPENPGVYCHYDPEQAWSL